MTHFRIGVVDHLKLLIPWEMSLAFSEGIMRLLIATICLAFAMITMVYSQVAIGPTPTSTMGLLAAYPMTNGMDVSGNNRTMTLTNTTAVPAKYSTGQGFNGTSSRGAITGITLTNRYTLSAWVYLGVPPVVLRALANIRVGPRSTN